MKRHRTRQYLVPNSTLRRDFLILGFCTKMVKRNNSVETSMSVCKIEPMYFFGIIVEMVNE